MKQQFRATSTTIMVKKSKRNRSSTVAGAAGAAATTASEDGSRRVAPPRRVARASAGGRTISARQEDDKNSLRFEDPFPDQFEDEEEWSAEVGSEVDDNDHDADDDDDGDLEEVVQSWNPFSGEAGEKLEMDPSAYKMHHSLTPEWPSLSFDFVRDEWGEARTRFPHSLLAAVGTQADKPSDNQLTIMKLSDLAKMPVETDDDILGEEYDPSKLGDKDNDDDNDESDEDSDVNEADLDPVVEHYSIKHYGGVNRIRAMPQQSNVVATWSDAGRVNLFNVDAILQRFAVSEGRGPSSSSSSSGLKDLPTKPFFSYAKHGTEGFALDWSTVAVGHLASGDCHGRIHLWSPRADGTYAVTKAYDTSDLEGANPSSSSVEDLQWSPSESTVLASAECGGYVRIYDSRAPHRAMLSHKIHLTGSDVNVLSWNPLVHNLLATGGDDGALCVWDLRHFSNPKPKPLARFTPHTTPINAVEWHPTDESMLAASDDRGAYVYDLSVEEDDTAVGGTGTSSEQHPLPPQLLFVHCGSEQFKEVHWHPQISSLLMTTALSGYSVFIPSNL